MTFRGLGIEKMREKSENIKILTGLGILSKIRINPETGKDFDTLRFFPHFRGLGIEKMREKWAF